ncbi:MAG: enoyl-CoA hydratase/isomerase family protein [Phycisphaerales bacterium]|nr:enoyl-CoA hydratase/isomerase family protein [Phycisphaerales bacterium]
MPVEPLPIERETTGPSAGVVTIRLDQPGRPVVVLDHALVQRLEAAFKAVDREAARTAGLILASASDRVFVAGADLKAITDLDDAALHTYLEYAARVFGMLCRFPFPTVAAINGAALGGGLELAMHCGGLIGAPSASGKPYPIGLPEAGLGICPGWGGTNLLPARIPPAEAIRRTATGQPMNFDEAAAAGLFDAVAASPGELLAAAKSWLLTARRFGRAERNGEPMRWIGRPGRAAEVLQVLDAVRMDLPETEAAAAVLGAIDAGLTRGWDAAVKTERKELVRLRHTPPARAAIEAFFARAAKK